MGIDNVDFAKVAWFRPDLFPANPNQYLNLLGTYEQSVIIADNFAKKYSLKEGDLLSITLQQQPIEFIVVGILPYWPSQYPEQTPFFITNLEYIYDQAPILPYEVWLKMKPDAKVKPIVDSLLAKNMELVSVKDVRNELIIQKKHPARGGVFGILSLGFLVSVAVSLVGYLLYWFFNLSSRVVQFGVLRAMGLSRKQLTGMLLLEQSFTAGLSIVLGIGIGKLTSYLFLPFLQTSENVKTQVPPFRVVFNSSDTNQLYVVVSFMMITGATLLFLHIRKLRVHQAVKLGEEK
jgi:putative ABC transport system permease protein